MLFATRVLVGIGEGGYGPAAPTILADLFPLETRGRILALFCAAIPVGSALGYVLGGAVLTHFHFVPEPERWRYAFYLAAIPGLFLGGYSLFQRDPRESSGGWPGPATGPARGLPRSRAHAILCPELCGPDRDDVRARRNRILGRGLSKVSGTTSLRHTNLWSHYCRALVLSRPWRADGLAIGSAPEYRDRTFSSLAAGCYSRARFSLRCSLSRFRKRGG